MAHDEPPIRDLIRAYALSLEGLRARGVIRSTKVLADYAEWLAAQALDLTLVPSGSNKGYDALDAAGTRYQIKARRLVLPYVEPNIVGLHNLDDRPFDVLLGILLDEDYVVTRAVIVPLAVVRQRATKTGLYLGSGLLTLAEVRDVTEIVRRASES